MLGRHDGDRLFRHINAEARELLVNRWEMLAHKFGRLMADIEMHIIKAEALDLIVNRARHHIARGQLHPFRVVIRHKAVARLWVQQMPALAAHRLCDEEVFDLQIIKAGRVELHHLHIGNARARSPCHADSIACCAARRGGELIDAARSASGQNSGFGEMLFHCAGCFIQSIGAPDAAPAGKFFAMAPRDKVNASAPGQHCDIVMRFGSFEERFLHGPSGRIIDMDDPAMRMPALAGEMQITRFLVERHAQLHEIINGLRSALDHEIDRLLTVEAAACHHCIAHMVFKRIASVQHSCNPALRPCGGASGERAFCEHQNALGLSEFKRRRQSRSARADDENIVIMPRHASLMA